MIGILLILAFFCGATILLESIPVLFVWERKAWWKAGVICNIITNPVLNVVMLLLSAMLPQLDLLVQILLALEILVVFLEAFFYQRMLRKVYWRCFLFSLFANLISFATGLIFKDFFMVFL